MSRVSTNSGKVTVNSYEFPYEAANYLNIESCLCSTSAMGLALFWLLIGHWLASCVFIGCRYRTIVHAIIPYLLHGEIPRKVVRLFICQVTLFEEFVSGYNNVLRSFAFQWFNFRKTNTLVSQRNYQENLHNSYPIINPINFKAPKLCILASIAVIYICNLEFLRRVLWPWMRL